MDLRNFFQRTATSAANDVAEQKKEEKKIVLAAKLLINLPSPNFRQTLIMVLMTFQ